MKRRWKTAVWAQTIVGLLIGGFEYNRRYRATFAAAEHAIADEKLRRDAGLPASEWAAPYAHGADPLERS